MLRCFNVKMNLALSLFVFGIFFTDNKNALFAADYLTITTKFFNG